MNAESGSWQWGPMRSSALFRADYPGRTADNISTREWSNNLPAWLGRLLVVRTPISRRAAGAVLTLTVAGTLTACTGSGPKSDTPGLAARGAALTTVKPTRQSVSNSLSLSAKVSLDPVFGLVAPVGGQVRYLDVPASQGTPTKPTRVANVWVNGKAHPVDVPAGATFAGRLVDDRSTVTAGMPIVSAKYVGYGIVADIDGAQAYQVSDNTGTAQAQVKNGPGPFPCTVIGTIAALPAGTVPAPPAPSTPPSGAAGRIAVLPQQQQDGSGSDATGMRLVCTAPAGTRLISGATATVQLVTAHADNVLVLPVEAVAGSQGTGKVDVVRPDGTRETRDVVLGLTDGKVVEIRSGLTGDENIAVPGPNLPTAAANQPQVGGTK